MNPNSALTTNSPIKSSRRLIDMLCNTELFRNYSAAFSQTTGLCLTLEAAAEGEDLPQAVTTFSITGVIETRLPVKLGKSLVAVLHTGGVRTAAATSENFTPVASAMLDNGSSAAEIRVERDAFSKLARMEPARYEAAVELLKSFACHLGERTHQLLFAESAHGSTPVRLAKEYIKLHLNEPLSLETVSSNVNVSPFHFCKVFKRCTGLTFTDYVNHVRVEKARRMLLRPDARITDVAYDVGFQSLSQFNRSFRRIMCESPTEYRARLKSSRPSILTTA